MLRPIFARLKKRFAASGSWLHWPLLSVLGFLLAFAVLFGGVALAAYDAGFASGYVTAALCGAAALVFVRFFVRSMPAVQRLIDTLHPPGPHAPARPDEIPTWAVVLYWLIGIAVIFTIIALEQTYTRAVMEFFIAWAAGSDVLDLFWPKRDLVSRLGPKRDQTTLFDLAFDVFDQWLDDRAARHRTMLSILGITLGFVALFGGVALYALQSGVTRVAGALCDPACLATAGFQTMVAAACGAAAILFVTLYTRLTLAAQRVFIDPFKFVRPEPKPEAADKWVTVLHVVLGFIFLFVMTGVGQMDHLKTSITVVVNPERPEAMVLILGWWLGGRSVLRFFWAKWRRSERFSPQLPARRGAQDASAEGARHHR